MNATVEDPDGPRPASVRVALARLADGVVARMAGAALSAGPDRRWLTPDAPHAIRGVVAVAQPDGRYELELHLVVAWPPGPLERLASDLRRRIQVAAKRAGVEDQIGEISVHIDEVLDPGEPHVTGGVA